MGKNGFTWFLGVVEDRNDPEKIGRVRVRCFGWHTEDKEDIPTATLPWAHVVQAPNVPASYTCRLGDYVFGFFMDGDAAQQPMILGVLPGKPTNPANPNLGFNDPTGFHPQRPGESTLSTLATNKKKYPINWVLESESGQSIQLDDAGEQIVVTHPSGTTVTFNKDGDQVTLVAKDYKVQVAKNISIQTEKNCTFSVGGTFQVNAKDISLVAADDVSVAAKGTATVTGSSGFTATGGQLVTATFSSGDSGASMSSAGTNVTVNPLTASITGPGGTVSATPLGVDVNCAPGIPIPPALSKLAAKINELKTKFETFKNQIKTQLQLAAVEFLVNTGIADGIVRLREVSDKIATFKKKFDQETANTSLAIAQKLSPVTNFIDRINRAKNALDRAVVDIENALQPLERIVGKELFPRTKYFDNPFQNESIDSVISALYQPIRELNDEVVNLNVEFLDRIVLENKLESSGDELTNLLNELNGATHDLNQLYNLNVTNRDKMINILDRIRSKLDKLTGDKLLTYEDAEGYDFFDLIRIFNINVDQEFENFIDQLQDPETITDEEIEAYAKFVVQSQNVEA